MSTLDYEGIAVPLYGQQDVDEAADDGMPVVDLDPFEQRSDDDQPPSGAVTARAALRDPFANLSHVRREPFQAPEVDLERCVIGGRKLHANVIDAVIDAAIERTIDGASTFTLTLADPDGDIRRSELIYRDVDCTIDGRDYRLSNVSKQGKQLVLLFETVGIVLLKQKFGYKRAYRRTHKGGKGMTRAEFVLSLVREVKRPRIPVVIPDLHEIRPVGKFDAAPKRRDEQRAPGVSRDQKFGGKRINAAQAHNIDVALTEALRHKAQQKACISMLCSGFGESGWRDIMNGNFASVEVFKAKGSGAFGHTSGYGGVLQGDVTVGGHIGHFYNMKPDQRTAAQAKHYMIGGYGYQGGGAIELARKHQDWNVGQIAVTVEGSGSNFPTASAAAAHYGKYVDDAKAIFKDWKSGTPGSTISYSRVKKYAFIRHSDQSSWDTIRDLAQQDSGTKDRFGNLIPLGYRAFFVGNTFYYVSEQHLFGSRSRMTLSEDAVGVDNIDFEYDRGHPVQEVTVTCRARFWTAPPGTVVTLEKMGIQIDGKWLVESIGRSRGNLNTQITLRKPQATGLEPAPEVEKKSEQVAGSVSSKHAAKGGIFSDKNLGRIDQGVDWSGHGPVIALADGIVTRAVESGSGWPGGTMVVTKLDEPIKMRSHAGGKQRTYRYVYYAENIHPIRVRQNRRVSAGDVIGTALGVYPFIEVGFANDAMGTTYASAHGEANIHPNHANTPAGFDFAEWMGFGTNKGYAYGGGPRGTGRI